MCECGDPYPSAAVAVGGVVVVAAVVAEATES